MHIYLIAHTINFERGNCRLRRLRQMIRIHLTLCYGLITDQQLPGRVLIRASGRRKHAGLQRADAKLAMTRAIASAGTALAPRHAQRCWQHQVPLLPHLLGDILRLRMNAIVNAALLLLIVNISVVAAPRSMLSSTTADAGLLVCPSLPFLGIRQ